MLPTLLDSTRTPGDELTQAAGQVRRTPRGWQPGGFFVALRAAILTGMTDPKPTLRWYQFTPDRAVWLLLLIEGLLLLSERFQWLPFNHYKGWTVLIAITSIGVVMLVMLLWFVAALLFRCRFQFSIRSLMVLTVAVAVPCSWLAVKMKQAERQRKAVEAIAKMRGGVVYDWVVDAKGKPVPTPTPSAPPWLRRALGDDFFWKVKLVFLNNSQVTDSELEHIKGFNQLQRLELNGTQVTDSGLEHLKGLSQLQWLTLDHTQVTDRGLEHLKGLSQLQTLLLDGTQVTDVGLERLKGLRQLQELSLNDTQITDEGVKKLKGLNQLQGLFLEGTQVTDAGLEHLKGLKQLQKLWLDGRKVTDGGVKKLQLELPNCKID